MGKMLQLTVYIIKTKKYCIIYTKYAFEKCHATKDKIN